MKTSGNSDMFWHFCFILGKKNIPKMWNIDVLIFDDIELYFNKLFINNNLFTFIHHSNFYDPLECDIVSNPCILLNCNHIYSFKSFKNIIKNKISINSLENIKCQFDCYKTTKIYNNLEHKYFKYTIFNNLIKELNYYNNIPKQLL